jgi:hypothetical protein
MAKYVKSHSNYVLKTKHQEINDGIAYERDITTIGGRDRFAKGQIPIYKSGNFVITVNGDNTAYKKTPSQEWKGNDEGDVWTLDILKNYEKDEKSSYDERIVIKKDYYDLRDFAYFGSCSELIRTSVNNVIDKFPGELFVPTIDVWIFDDGAKFYSKEVAEAYANDNGVDVPEKSIETISVTYTDTKNPLVDEHGEKIYTTLPVTRNFKLPEGVDNGPDATLFVIDNPFGINIHNYMLPEGADPLKYFAEGGINNYVAYSLIDGEWDFDNPIEIKSEGLVQYFDPERKVLSKIVVEEECKNDTVLSTGKPIYTQDYCPGDYMGYVDINMGEGCGMVENKNCVSDTVNIGLSITGDVNSCYARIYVFMGDNNEVKYFVDPNFVKQEEGKIYTIGCMLSKRIRPKNNIIEDYYKSLNSFEQILLNRDTDYSAMFEVINESDYGYYVETKRYKFPTTYGGYNLGSKGSAFAEYLEKLVKIGEYYDERFTDNLWRSMTHEAIRNFDWTYTRHFNPGDEIDYVEGGSKIQKIIRLYGREFDEIRSYIDGITNCNTITYDNINNLPDYFFTDKLEEDGWDVKLVNPLKITNYANGIDVTNNVTPAQNKANTYGSYHIDRIFNDDFGTTSVKPYTKEKINSVRNVICDKYIKVDTDGDPSCISDEVNVQFAAKNALINSAETTCYGTKQGENQRDGYHDDCCNVVKMYTSEVGYTTSEINSEFFKRLILNSKSILRHKGTKDSIEMILAMFGLRSKDYVFNNDTYFRVARDNSGESLVLSDFGKQYYRDVDLNNSIPYDYEVKEYTAFTTRITDTYDSSKQMYFMDWINSLKLTTYNTPEFRSGRYVSYQGLPVAYRLVDNGNRYVYPSFQNYFQYDGGMYYQMNGGWLSKSPFMFDTKNNIIPEEKVKYSELFTETVKNIKCVQTLDELLKNGSLATEPGEICQVIDLSGKYAIVDGNVYDIVKDDDGFDFFNATIWNNSLAVGNALFTGFVYISNPYAQGGKVKIDLSDDSYNGKNVKIYIVNGNVDVHSNSSSISTFTIFENGKYMDGNNFTHYFRINDPDYSNELSVLGWQQLRDTEYEYYMMDAVVDYDKGNNPHTGNMMYDKGHEYLNRYAHLFKPIYENGLFFTSGVDEDVYELSQDYGFIDLVNEEECEKNYDQYLYEDDKCHFFGDLLTKDGITHKYNLDSFNSLDSLSYRWVDLNFGRINKYHYGDKATGTKDGVTNQIVNTKRVDIDFFLDKEEYSNEWLEEVKYVDSVILPYLTQVIPSNIILTVKYKQKTYRTC